MGIDGRKRNVADIDDLIKTFLWSACILNVANMHIDLYACALADAHSKIDTRANILDYKSL